MNDGPPPEDIVDPALAGLAEEITTQLQGGKARAVEAIIERHPAEAGALRAMLPTLRRLAELARVVSPRNPRGRDFSDRRPPVDA
ncbi:hypothetical protein [Aquisphaera insulae]|uniref:hypothetical protein n=1 Tax=Aquisphaera insulae TaxID=2712864 RepID=UPI0013EC92D8|nr:hypothetical protein [Aquisphaera insulae]